MRDLACWGSDKRFEIIDDFGGELGLSGDVCCPPSRGKGGLELECEYCVGRDCDSAVVLEDLFGQLDCGRRGGRCGSQRPCAYALTKVVQS